MKRCARCFGQMIGELIYRAVGGAATGQRWTCLQCGEAYEVFPELPAVDLTVRHGRPPKARAE